MALRLRRGTDAERLLVTPLQGELVYATDTKKLYVGDGATVGGVLVGPADADSFTELVADTTPQLGGNLDLNGNNITGTGNIDIDGTITATGNIGLGDDTSDIINVGGVINSSLRPAIDGNYDLGSTIRRWNRLYAEGAVFSGQVDSEAIATGKIISNSSSVVFDEVTDTLSSANITATDINTTTLTVQTISASVLEGDVKGSLFGDDSTPVIDGVNKTISVTGGTLDGVEIGQDGITPAKNITGREITATNGFTGNLSGDVSGTVTGDVLSGGAAVLIDSSEAALKTTKLTLKDDNINGSTAGTTYDSSDFPSADPVVVVGDRSNTNTLFVEGDEVPLVIRGEGGSSSGTTVVLQSSRFTGETLNTLQENDYISQIAFDGYNGSIMKRGAIITTEVKSALNAGNFDADMTIGVLQETGLYSQFFFRADGRFESVAASFTPLSDAVIASLSVPEGSFGYGSDRDAPVIYDGSTFLTVPTVVSVPGGPTATGKAGQVAGDANYMYFCHSDDNWIRVAKDGTWT